MNRIINKNTKRERFQAAKYARMGAYHWDLYKKKNSLYYPLVCYVVNCIPSKSKVLDLGCGDGLISYCLAEKGCEVVGVDIDKIAIELAKEKIKNTNFKIKFTCCDIFNFKTIKKFDWAISIDVIEHLADPIYLLNILKKNGINKLIGTPEAHENSIHKHQSHIKEYTEKELFDTVQSYFSIKKIDTVLLQTRKQIKKYFFLNGK